MFIRLAAVICLVASPAAAQATRTWVSGVGDDANPCSRTAPCKTFAGAISKTAANGEISILDPAGYGAVTITKSISIVGMGAEAGILAAGTNGITVNAPNGVVHLRGLYIEGAATGINGVRVLDAAAVHVDDTVIRGFRAQGKDSGAAVRVAASAKGNVTVTGSVLSDSLVGVANDSPTAQVWLGSSIVTGNQTAAAGKINSYGDNAVHGNAADGAAFTKVPRR
jgi:hypothetical protein